MTEQELCYIAGFFDGEGSAHVCYPKATNGKRYARLTAKLTQVDRSVLDWIHELYGYGLVHSKGERKNPEHRECFDLSFQYKQARAFLTSIEPYLRVKKETVSTLLDTFGRIEKY